MRIFFGNMPDNVCTFSVGNHQSLQFDSNALISINSQGGNARHELKNILLKGIAATGLQMNDQHQNDLDTVIDKYLSILLVQR
jgi:hypothetical protein